MNIRPMPLLVFFYCFLLLLPISGLESSIDKSRAVTYSLSGPRGRFGDNVIAYIHGKWIAYKYNLLFIYTPFLYSDQLRLHEKEKYQLMACQHLFKKRKNLKNEKDALSLPKNTLLYVPFFPNNLQEYQRYKKVVDYFHIDWDDECFINGIKEAIKPRFPIQTIDLSQVKDYPVALHVRKGGNFDQSNIHLIYPIKFPPDSFYVSALETMSELLNHKKMYVCLFTDDLNPSKLLEKFQELTSHLNIQFDYYKSKSKSETSFLEDFFSIIKFKGLIRAESHFSAVAEKIGDFEVIIHPLKGHINKKKEAEIDEINVINLLPPSAFSTGE